MDQSSPLAGRVALVTGASRGIGAAAAVRLAQAGAHVVAVARSREALHAVDEAIRGTGGEATLVALDMTDTAGLARLAAEIGQSFQRLDILVANAGLLGRATPVTAVAEADWDELFAVNLAANWRLIRLFDPLLKRSDAGRAVFVTSGLARRAVPGVGVYAATKAALDALVRTYAAEQSAHGALRVNLFSPGATRTGLYTTAFPATDPATLPTPDEVAVKLVDLCLPSVTQTGGLYDFRSARWLPSQATPGHNEQRGSGTT